MTAECLLISRWRVNQCPLAHSVAAKPNDREPQKASNFVGDKLNISVELATIVGEEFLCLAII